MKKNVVFVGGHHTCAIAVLDKLLEESPAITVHWIGHKFSASNDRNVSAEFREITSRGIPFYNLCAGKVYRTYNPIKLIKVPIGFFHALYLLFKIRPILVVSFGGYLAPPVVFWSFVLRIPVITHEQTRLAGWANIFVSKFADLVLLTWSSSLKFFPPSKSKVIGLPLREGYFSKKRDFWPFSSERRTILITGGKQGAHDINVVAGSVLERLLNRFNVILQCGNNSFYKDFDMLLAKKSRLPDNLKERFILRRYLFGSEWVNAIKNSDIVVGRSGGHIIYEICFLKKVALLLPKAKTSHNEQEENAFFVKECGLGEVITAESLSGDTLVEALKKMDENYKNYVLTKKLTISSNATEKFILEIKKFVH